MFSERLGIPTYTGSRNLTATDSIMRQAGQASTSPGRAALENSSSSSAGSLSPGAQSSQYSPIFLQVTCLPLSSRSVYCDSKTGIVL